ncbi:MAG: pyruvate, phosphate dikinase, partial [Thermoplasmata archaeon]|nr:pyruvate, phosphate dikinase [Thermoplasmata archaeon]
PGMMDTVLNLGLNDDTVEGLARVSGDERFAYDSYRRFIQMYGDVVLGVGMKNFEHALEAKKAQKNVDLDTELDEAAMDELVNEFLAIVKEKTGNHFPADPDTQLDMAIKAVFNSWDNQRARTYRRLNSISHDIGTAVNVQVMVFGNYGQTSGTGVAFTRNPATGEKEYYGEYLMNAQGEDVVAGIRTPKPVTEMEQEMPSQYEELKKAYATLENHYKDIQDFEFTIEEGTLYLLQTRNGKRTAQAAIKAAVDMMKEGLITKEEAIMHVDPGQLDQLLHPIFDPTAEKKVIAKGLNASPGAATGKVVFDSDRAVEMVNNGEKIILVRTETSPEDIHGMDASEGILTARGGMTSHAAVVARGMGKSCVAGCDAITVNEKECQFFVGDICIKEGDWLSLDGSTGEVILGQVPTKEAVIGDDFKELMSWADEIRTLHVKTNAEVPKDVQVAKDFGAEGIGLARTEHMFFGEDRLPWIQRMVLATNETERKAALDKLLPMQRHDFEEVFTIMDKLPVIIRLLDPPLHEFLPKEDEDIQALGQTLGIPAKEIKETAESLAEFNPMLGFRGCRLGIIYPEINAMQARAIFEAGMNVLAKGIKPIIQIEVPLVGKIEEFILIRNIIHGVAKEMGIQD